MRKKNPNDSKNINITEIAKEAEDMKDIHAKLVPADQEEKADTEAKAAEQKNPAKKVSLKKEPVVKQEAPAKKAPAKKTPAKKNPAKKAAPARKRQPKKDTDNKNTSEQDVEKEDNTQQKPDNRLDDILKLAQNNAEMISSLNRKVNKLDERMDDMKRSAEAAGGAPVPPDQTLTPRQRNLDKWRNWLKSEKHIPGWVLLLLVILLLILTLLLDGAMFAYRRNPPANPNTVVTAQHGAIAINGNVTINVYQDRATAAEGTEVETSYTRPLVYLNYNGAEGDADDSVVIDTTQDGTCDVTVGDSTVKVEAPN